METVSQKRGRPPAFDSEELKIIAACHPDVTTRRGLVAKCYEVEAVQALAPEGNLTIGVDRIFSNTRYCATVLEHLGRLKRETACSHSDIRKLGRIVNRRIVDDGYTVRDAVRLLKIVRLAEREGAAS